MSPSTPSDGLEPLTDVEDGAEGHGQLPPPNQLLDHMEEWRLNRGSLGQHTWNALLELPPSIARNVVSAIRGRGLAGVNSFDGWVRGAIRQELKQSTQTASTAVRRPVARHHQPGDINKLGPDLANIIVDEVKAGRLEWNDFTNGCIDILLRLPSQTSSAVIRGFAGTDKRDIQNRAGFLFMMAKRGAPGLLKARQQGRSTGRRMWSHRMEQPPADHAIQSRQR